MIVGIEGKIVRREPTRLHLLTAGGLIYELFVSLHTGAAVGDKERVRLHTTFIVREDLQQLYGFAENNEKRLFDTLIRINGVGPKVALAVCSTFTPSAFAKIVEANDVKALKRVPGIGPKSAGRILVELSGFSPELAGEEGALGDSARSEAALALESLGFKKEQVVKVLASCRSESTEALIKEALKLLSR